MAIPLDTQVVVKSVHIPHRNLLFRWLDKPLNNLLQIWDSLKEAEKNLEALKKERERSILGEILEKERNIKVLEREFTKASKKSQLEKLYSPVNGTVQQAMIWIMAHNPLPTSGASWPYLPEAGLPMGTFQGRIRYLLHLRRTS